jgi:SAM-dependent methyltransferase
MATVALDLGSVAQARRRSIQAPVAGANERRASTSAFYDEHADAYAATTMALHVADRIARFARELPAGGRVLDAGCGSGRDLVALRAAGFDPVGLDLSPRLARLAEAHSGAPVKVGDLRSPPFDDSSFEGIWAMASLLHIEREEVTGSLRNLGQLLAPGGVLFASVKRGEGRVRDKDGRWFTLHDEDGWARHLKAAGFDIVELVGEPAHRSATGTVAPGWISSIARLAA